MVIMAGQGASEVKAEPQASDRPRGETGDIVGPGSRQKRRWPLAHHPKPRHLSASKLSAFRLFASSRKSLNSSASSAVGSSTIGAAVSAELALAVEPREELPSAGSMRPLIAPSG